jgi:hypothetical protein
MTSDVSFISTVQVKIKVKQALQSLRVTGAEDATIYTQSAHEVGPGTHFC